MKVLLIEDDEIFAAAIIDYLATQNYIVEFATTGEKGWQYAQATQYDLIVLDLNLPDWDGIGLCQKLRRANYEGAILLLTAESDSQHKVMGLDAGADDYVVKPCLPEELSARMRALLRRPRESASPILRWGRLQLDPSTCQVKYGDQDINLSPKEYGLLELFLRYPQRIFSSTALLERLWSFDETPGEETIRTHIKRLRRKLKLAGTTDIIENIYGMGYRLMPPPVAPPDCPSATPVVAPLPPALTTLAPEAADTARAAAISALSKFQPTLEARLTILETVVTTWQTALPSPSQLQQAQQAAHKLVGSLGMFGLAAGSTLSRHIEEQLQADPTTVNPQQIATAVSQLRHLLTGAIAQATTAPPPLATPPLTTADHGVPLSPTEPLGQRQLHVLSPDVAWRTALATLAQGTLTVEPLADLAAVLAAMQQPHGPLLLIDLAALTDWQTVLPVLQQIATHSPNWPVFIRLQTDTFAIRLALSRCHNCLFVTPQTPLQHVVDSGIEVYQQRFLAPVRVLAVDDDPLILQALEEQLTSPQLHVETLNNPLQLWDTLTSSPPDLLLLDVEMPDVEGVELCQVIRSDRRWRHLPILFLTAHRDPATILRIYGAGADDYVAKPVDGPALTNRIFNRLKRYRATQQGMINDPITGLMTEDAACRALSRDLALAQRHRQPYCLAVITLTSPSPAPLSLIQDRIGQLVDCLSPKLRREDLLAQLAEGEFWLGLYGISSLHAQSRLQQLLQGIQPVLPAPTPQSRLTAQLSYAIAPDEGTTISSLRQVAISKLPEATSFRI